MTKQKIFSHFLFFSTFIFFLNILSGCYEKKEGEQDSLQRNDDLNFYNNVSINGLFLASQYARINQDYKLAGDFLEKISNRPDAPTSMLKDTYTILAVEGRIKEASYYAQKELSIHPHSFLASLIVATDLTKEGDYQGAYKVLSSIPEKGFEKYFLAVLKSWLLYGEGKGEEALKTLSILKDEQAFIAPYHFHRGLISDLLGKDKEAAESYEYVLGKDKENSSIRVSQVAISFYRRTNQPSKVAEILSAYKKDPDKQAYAGASFLLPEEDVRPINSAQQGFAETLLGMSANLSLSNGNEMALILLKMALYLDPELTVGKVLLAELFEEEGMPAKAIEVYASLGKESELYYSGQIRRVSLLNKEKRYEESTKLLESLIKDYPDRVLPLIELGDSYRDQGNYSKAAEIYSQAIEKIGNKEETPWTVYYSRGISLERTGKWQEAEQDFLTALEKNPEDPFILNYLGYSWLEKGKNLTNAKNMIAQAIEKSPDNGYIMDSFGWAFYKTGEYDRAVRILEIAVELEPGNSLINDHLGDAYWKVGRKREAYYQWQKALNFNFEITPTDISRINFKLSHGLEEWEKEERKE